MYCFGEVFYKYVCVPGEYGINLGHEFEGYEYLAGLVC
jgi:hypothetical protein